MRQTGAVEMPATVSLERGRRMDHWVERRVGRFVPDSPAGAGAIAVLGAALFALVRLFEVASGDAGWFVLAGDAFTDPRRAGIPVGAGAGYDGQFFYRIASDLFSFAHEAHGVAVDTPLRFQRVGYPFIAWVISGGGRVALPAALIAVNLAALGALGWLGAMVARANGRHAMWGLLLPVYFGFVFTLARDLSEIVEVAFLVGGLVALRSRRPWLAALLLSGAVLTRETALFAVAGIGVARVVTIARRDDRPGRADLAWVIPPLAFAAWQGVVYAGTDALAATSTSANTFVVPGSRLVGSLDDQFPIFSAGRVLHAAELVVLLAVLGAAVLTLRATTAPLTDRFAFVALLIAALSVDIVEGIWVTLHDFRMFGDVYALAILVLLGSRRNVTPYAISVVACALGSAAFLVRNF